MTELSVDHPNEAVTKAQVEFKQAQHDRDVKQAGVIRAQAEVIRAQIAVRATSEQIDATMNALASLDAQVLNTDSKNGPAIRRLSAEQSDLGIQRRALEGQKQREQEQLKQAQADASVASAAFSAAEDALKKARDHLTDCEYDAQEARYLKAGEALPPHLAERKAFREHMEAEDHMRKVRSCWDEVERRYVTNLGERSPSIEEKTSMLERQFEVVWAERHGGKPASAEPSLPRADRPAPKALAENEIGWGRHARPFDSAPVPVASVERVRGGTGKGEYDPFAAEND